MRRQRTYRENIPTFSANKKEKTRRKKTAVSRQRRCCWLTLLSSCCLILVVLYLIYYFAFSEFAWVHSKCFLSFFRGTVISKIQCVEAATHERVALDPTLWFDGANNEKNGHHNIPFDQTTASQYVHYTITTAPQNKEVFSLALCSMEASGRICQETNCTVQVWIVDQATNTDMLNSTTWFQELQKSLKPYSHCFRVSGATADQLIGPGCSEPLQNLPPHVRDGAKKLRQWLTSPLATHNQLPAHVSDGWRLLALAEFGGLYLDADVLPLSTDIVKLPSTTIPTQDKVGAYRLNGGTLRLGNYAFVEAMIDDHLKWAPLLAQLPQEKQTFGFLGPCALTRVYTAIKWNSFLDEHITILPPNVVEPRLMCDRTDKDRRPLGLHFSGHRKTHWQSNVNQSSCWRDLIHSLCPRTLLALDNKEILGLVSIA